MFDEGYLSGGGRWSASAARRSPPGGSSTRGSCPVYDAGEIDGRAFISMRLVPGDTWPSGWPAPGRCRRPRRSRCCRTSPRRSTSPTPRHRPPRRQARQHPAGPGRRWLSDFGLVRLDDMPGLTRRGDWLGTAEYVSPEQVEGEPATQGSDRLLPRGRRVRGPHRPGAVRAARAERDAARPRPRAGARAPPRPPSLPPAVDAVLARGLAEATPPSARRARAAWSRSCAEALDSGEPAAVPASCAWPAAAAGAGDDPWNAALAPVRRSSRPDGGRLPHPGLRRCRAAQPAPRQPRPADGRRRGGDAPADRRRASAAGCIGTTSADASGAEARGFQEGASQGKHGLHRRARPGPGRGAQGRQGRGPEAGPRRRAQGGQGQGTGRGRAEGRAAGVAEGRSAALGGLTPGGWYIVRVGSDDAGAGRLQPDSVSTDASQCYTVSGGTVLSGPC